MTDSKPQTQIANNKTSESTEVPEKYLEQQPAFFAAWLKNMNVFIGLPGVEDPKAVFGDVPQERFAKASKAGFVKEPALHK